MLDQEATKVNDDLSSQDRNAESRQRNEIIDCRSRLASLATVHNQVNRGQTEKQYYVIADNVVDDNTLKSASVSSYSCAFGESLKNLHALT